MSCVLAVTNQKGGVGKTTTCVNLAASLAAIERKVLLADMDPQANSTTGCGADTDTIEGSMYRAIRELERRNAERQEFINDGCVIDVEVDEVEPSQPHLIQS